MFTYGGFYMKKNVLICSDNFDEVKSIQKKFNLIRISTEFCGKSGLTVLESLRKNDFTTAIFIAESENDRIIEEIVPIKKHFPNTKFILISCFGSYSKNLSYFNDNDISFIQMPNTSNFMFGKIVNCVYDKINPFFMSDIYEFMFARNFPSDISGFFYTCSAVEIGIKHPEIFKDRAFCSIYPEIAQRYGVTPASVERNMRTFSAHTFKENKKTHCIETIYKHEQKKAPTNMKLVKAFIRNISPDSDLYFKIINSPEIND